MYIYLVAQKKTNIPSYVMQHEDQGKTSMIFDIK